MGAATIGALAACLTTGAWIPQLVRTWRSRSARDLSWPYLATTLIGITLWMVYGILRRDPAMFGANVVAIAFVAPLCVGKAISDRRTARAALPSMLTVDTIPSQV